MKKTIKREVCSGCKGLGFQWVDDGYHEQTYKSLCNACNGSGIIITEETEIEEEHAYDD